MSSAYLEDYIDNARYHLDLLVPALERNERGKKELQPPCDTYGPKGVCTVRLGGDPKPFWVSAMQSASAYAHFLSTVDNSEKVTSQAKGFYDAVGCGFWECAEAIATHSRTSWNTGYEYEDDFLFIHFLMKCFFLGADKAECEHIIARHKEAAEGADQEHRDVMIAFLERNEALFEERLRDLLEIRADRVEALVAREAIPEEHWSWLRYFSSEGFGLLGLATLCGFETDRDYLHVPQSLRTDPGFKFNFNDWRAPDYAPR